MSIKTKLLFILIGNDAVGKTTLQKALLKKICGIDRDAKMHCNLRFPIIHKEIKRKYETISFGNRSYQEKLADYKSVENYFTHHFNDADVAFISSHLISADVLQMIEQGKRRFFNVLGVFWTNSIQQQDPLSNSEISALNWDERFVIDNPITEDWEPQINLIAESIVTLIIHRTHIS